MAGANRRFPASGKTSIELTNFMGSYDLRSRGMDEGKGGRVYCKNIDKNFTAINWKS